MAAIGYARVSSTGQSLEVQLERLKEAGCTKVFSEKESGAKANRPQLAAMLEFIREGDTVTITKIDRLARSMADFWNTVEAIKVKGCSLKVLSVEGLDTATPTGRMIVGVLAALAEFERELIKERQYEGIQKAKEKGVFLGRKPIDKEIREKVNVMTKEGKKKAAIARELGIGRSTVYTILKEKD